MASPELKVRIKDKELYNYYNGNPELHKDALKWYKAHKEGFIEYANMSREAERQEKSLKKALGPKWGHPSSMIRGEK